ESQQSSTQVEAKPVTEASLHTFWIL
ncbi:uncharacterized protein METZ01_LOCUS438384, partial [marine metagenome]